MSDLKEQARCTATAKGTGERCRKPPTPGTNVCAKHGSSAGQVRRKAKQRVAEAKAARRLGGSVEPVHDPIGELRLVIGRAKALEEALWSRLQDDDLDAPEVGAWTSALDRLARVLVDFERLGLEERAVALQEAQARVVAEVIRMVLGDLQGRIVQVLPEGDLDTQYAVQGVFLNDAPALARAALEAVDEHEPNGS